MSFLIPKILAVPYWVWLLLSAIVFAAGEYLSKIFALHPSFLQGALAVACYTVAVILWLPAIFQTNHLAVTGAIWSVLSLLLTVLIGIVVFNESVTLVHMFGIFLGLAAVGFLSLG